MKIIAAMLLVLAFVGCSAPPTQDALTELAQESGYWKLAGADAFMDGGSHCLSFISPQGRLLHVFVLPDERRKSGGLVFELRRAYNDRYPAIITPHSDIERQVLWLLQNYSERDEIVIGRDHAEAMAYSLKHRREAFPFGEKFRDPKKTEAN